MKNVKIIGAGLAGCECALTLSSYGIKVDLFDIKPNTKTPAHHDENLCELVCSNSLKSDDVFANACGLLKEELRILDSFVIKVADNCKVPAGNALAVNRDIFAKEVTQLVKFDKNITFHSEEVEIIDFDENIIIATGPLTCDNLAKFISEKTAENLYFFDAAAPIVSRESIDFENAFEMDRYGEGEGDYINCPMDRETYFSFIDELIKGEKIELQSFEKGKIFEGCMPIEVMAERGRDTLRFGPLKPVGLFDPKTNKRPFAVLQLRKEDEEEKMYNLVGFQTNLKFSEQKRIFAMIPALKNAEFYRYGVMHKNIYINSPKILNEDFSMKKYSNVFFAGQISGVEGYVESIMSGKISAINMFRKLSGKKSLVLENDTVTGALCKYIATENENFQPMNANYGIIKGLDEIIKDKAQKKKTIALRAIDKIKSYKNLIKMED